MKSKTKYSVKYSPILKKYGVYDENGNPIIPYLYDVIEHFYDDAILVGKKSWYYAGNYIIHCFEYGLIDYKNNT